MTSKKFLDKYWDNFYKTCLDRNDPFEKYINEIYKNEFCVSPLKSLSVHFTNINSSYGLSPFIDYKKLWNENEYKLKPFFKKGEKGFSSEGALQT